MIWKLKVLTYVKFDILLRLFLKDLNFFTKIANLFFRHLYFTNNYPIIYDNIYLQFINIYPHIKLLITDHIPKKFEVIRINSNTYPSNRYILNGERNKYFIYSNYIIPHISNSSIPFTSGIIKNKKFKVITSNIFYFEVKIDKDNFRSENYDESCLIGFSSAEKNLSQIIFGKLDAFGLNLLENRVEINSEYLYLNDFIKKGDTVGIGLKYIEKFKYKIFITINGKQCNFFPRSKNNDVIITKSKLKVIINLNLSCGIAVNFGNEEFKFDIEKIIRSPVIINSSKNNLVNKGFNIDLIKSSYIYQNSFYTEYIYSLLDNQVIPTSF